MKYTVISCTKEQLPELEEMLSNILSGFSDPENQLSRYLAANTNAFDDGVWVAVGFGEYSVFSDPVDPIEWLDATTITFEEFKAKHT